MPGVGIDVGVAARVEAGVRIQAMIAAQAAAQATAEVDRFIEQALEQGDLVEEDGPETCRHCGALCGSAACPRCGLDQDEEPMQREADADQELPGSEEQPLHEDEDQAMEDLAEQDLAERFCDRLRMRGWPEAEAEMDGLTLAWLWERARPMTPEALEPALEQARRRGLLVSERLTGAGAAILEEFQRLAGQEPAAAPADRERVEIRIVRTPRGALKAEVVDPFRGLRVANGRARLELGFGSVSLSYWRKLQATRRRHLQKLAEMLIERRLDFFQAGTPRAAETSLTQQPLERKEAAARLGVDPSTVSRWCRSGLRVETPQGVYPLAAFFTVAVRARQEKFMARDGLYRMIAAALAEQPAANSTDVQNLVEKAEDYRLDRLDGRNFRRYVEVVRAARALLVEAPAAVQRRVEPLREWARSAGRVVKPGVWRVVDLLLEHDS